MTSKGSLQKRSSVDIIDQHLESDDTAAPQAPSFQIYRKTNKLKNKIKAIQIATRLSKTPHDSQKDEKKKANVEVFKPPDCLKDVLLKIKQEKKQAKENTTVDVGK